MCCIFPDILRKYCRSSAKTLRARGGRDKKSFPCRTFGDHRKISVDMRALIDSYCYLHERHLARDEVELSMALIVAALSYHRSQWDSL